MDEFHTSRLRRFVVLGVLSLIVAAAMAAPVLSLGAITDGSPARAVPAQLPTPPSGCGKLDQAADFSATFAWANGEGTSGARNTPMEIRIEKSQAQIYEVGQNSKLAGKCVAVCSLRNVGKTTGNDRKLATAFPEAIDMDCQAPGFAGLASPASLIFSSKDSPVLRFGSWASGYRDAALAVGTDRLTSASSGS